MTIMENKKLLDKVWVFTNWGLVEGFIQEKSQAVLVEDYTAKDTKILPYQYKVSIIMGYGVEDDDDDYYLIDYDFLFAKGQLFDSKEDAINSLKQ